jgi:hypothetical protein
MSLYEFNIATAGIGKIQKGKTEAILQSQCMCWLRDESQDLISKGNTPFVFFHVGNEAFSKNSCAYFMSKKRQGVIPGAPDIVVARNDKVAFIELKAPAVKRLFFNAPEGKLSAAQKLFKNWCGMAHVTYTVCYDLEEFKSVVESI